MSRKTTVLAPAAGFGAILLQLAPAALLCLLFAAVGIVHVTSRVLVVDAGYRLSQQEHDNHELSREHDRLKLELATLKSPMRLEKIARERLSMSPPSPGSLIRLPAPGRPSARPSMAALGRLGPTARSQRESDR